MDKNKILEAARNNKGKGQEYEDREAIRGELLSFIIAMLLGIILFFVELLVIKRVNISLITVGMTAAGVESLYRGIKIKKMYLIIIGIIELIAVLFLLLLFIVKVVV